MQSNTNTEVLVIETAKENQPRLTNRWTTEVNLAAQGADARSTAVSCSSYFEEKGYFVKQRSELDIFKPLDFYEILFDREKNEDKEACSKTTILIRTFVIRL